MSSLFRNCFPLSRHRPSQDSAELGSRPLTQTLLSI